jgi:hypothetical protein
MRKGTIVFLVGILVAHEAPSIARLATIPVQEKVEEMIGELL